MSYNPFQPYTNILQNAQNIQNPQNSVVPTDIVIPKNNISQALGLRQIIGFEPIQTFKDTDGKLWKLVKSSRDTSVEIPDPNYLQPTDYWCHEFPGSNGKIFIYVVEGIKIPRDENGVKMNVLYQWFSTTKNNNFTPQMITQPEWHKANVYSSELTDARISKLCALCKVENEEPKQEPVTQEHIDDINIDAIMKS